MAQLIQITPMFPVRDVDEAVRFFEDILQFNCGFREDNYAFLYMDKVAIRLLAAGPDVDLTDPRAEQVCYIDVKGIDDMYARLKPQLDTLPEGHVRAPFDQYYGQREFHVIYESILLFYGEGIDKS